MSFILRWIGYALAVMLVAWIVPGITVTGFLSALVVAIVFGLINTFIKPILLFISLPINILTLGVFTLVINALLFWFTAYLLPNSFSVDGFWSALIGAIAFSIITAVVNFLTKK